MVYQREQTALLVSLTPRFLFGAGLIAAMSLVYLRLSDAVLVSGVYPESTLELLLLGVPAIGLLYSGYWLQTGHFSPEQVWVIGTYAIGGTLVAAVSTTAAILFLPVTILSGTASFPLFIATGSEGALIGVLVGAFTVTDVNRRRDHVAVDDLTLLQSVLRHDIRNRLTIASGNLDLVTPRDEGGAGAHRRTVQRQLDAIDELLEETRLATDAIVGGDRLEPIDLVDVVREQIALVEDSYDAVEIRSDLPESALVQADELLASAIENLLCNAVIHSDRDTPTITVSIDTSGDRFRLQIADDGPGIPDDRKARITEAGVGDGTGMGLYLADRLVDRYGGRLSIEDNEPRGTVVTIDFSGGRLRRPFRALASSFRSL